MAYRFPELQDCGFKRWEKAWIGQPHLIKKMEKKFGSLVEIYKVTGLQEPL